MQDYSDKISAKTSTSDVHASGHSTSNNLVQLKDGRHERDQPIQVQETNLKKAFHLTDNRLSKRQVNTDSTVQKKENKTGLPDNLKSGMENISGYSLDDVKVHYNSDKPTQLNAHAYAQGNDIHVATGQEKHLAHEAWHVVQQKQGRVKPTSQLKSIAINDSPHLETEADMMGQMALRTSKDSPILKKSISTSHVSQRITDDEQAAAISGIRTFAKSSYGKVSAPIWHLPNNVTLIGTSHGERLYNLPFCESLLREIAVPFDHIVAEMNPTDQARNSELAEYAKIAMQYKSLQDSITNYEGELPRELKIARAKTLPGLEKYLSSFPSLLDDTIIALASTGSTTKNSLETQGSRDQAEAQNKVDKKDLFPDAFRERVIGLSQHQNQSYAKGDLQSFFEANAEEQSFGYDHYDIEERNMQWLGKRGPSRGPITIPEFIQIPGRKLIIVGASHVPNIMMALQGDLIQADAKEQHQHELDLVRMGSDSH